MRHLNDEQIRALAQKIVYEESFDRTDELAMRHIACCDSCYELLRCSMSVIEVTDHIDLVVCAAEEAAPAKDSAVIKVVIVNAKAVLEQLRAQTAAWAFDTPLQLAGSRSARDGAADIQKLEDIENGQTYVAYDPARKLLIIQIDCGPDGAGCKASLRLPDGQLREISLERYENLLYAQISGLEEGEYQVILEK